MVTSIQAGGDTRTAAAPVCYQVVGDHDRASAATIAPLGQGDVPVDPPAGVAHQAIADNASLLTGTSVAAIACGLHAWSFDRYAIAWALGAFTLTLGWHILARAPAARPSRQQVTPWQRHATGPVGVVLVGWLLAPAILFRGPPLSTDLTLLQHGTALLVACCAAFVLAPRLELVIALIALVPAQWAGRLLLGMPLLPEQITLGGLFAVLAAWLAGNARKAWLRRLQAQARSDQRLAVAEQARCDAVQADEDKTRFLSATSHDLRQPVHALGLFAATLEKRLRGTRDESLVSNVVRSIDGLDRSLNAMLDVSRLDAGAVEPSFQHFPLRDVFRRLHMQFAGQADLAGLTLRFSPGGKWVTSDPQLLERILGNLIQNAMKYTARGGVAVVARTTATHFNLEVWDTGVGIAASQLPRIFDEYYQVPGHKALRQQGMGMGLSIVRRLVRLLGHGLTVTSQPGRGTMFRLSIAQGGAPELQDLTAPADTQPMPVGRVRTVLIVEDDDRVREGLALLLEEFGYAALQSSSLEEARQKLRVLELPPDLLLTDLRLGNGPNGLDVIRELRKELGFDLPVIVITGDTVTEELEQITERGYPVLFKPVDPRKLLLGIRGVVA